MQTIRNPADAANFAASVIRRHLPDTAYRVVLFGSRSAGERSDIEMWIEGPAPVSRRPRGATEEVDFRVALAEQDLLLAGQHQFAALGVEASARATTPIERCGNAAAHPRSSNRARSRVTPSNRDVSASFYAAKSLPPRRRYGIHTSAAGVQTSLPESSR
jgi:hypothetical protein